MPSVDGYVDFIACDQLGGWITPAQDGSRHVRLELRGVAIVAGEASGVRADVPNANSFFLSLPAPLTPLEILAGFARVLRVDNHGRTKELPFFPRALLRVVDAVLADRLASAELEDLAALMMGRLVPQSKAGNDPFRDVHPDVVVREWTSIAVPVGTRSADGAAVIGRKGHAFLLLGSNKLLDLYRQTSANEHIAGRAAEWISLFERRSDTLARVNITYRQLVIPGKATVLSDLFPVAINGPTLLFTTVEEKVGCSSAAGNYIFSLLGMLDHPDRASLFGKFDTHLSVMGAIFLFGELLAFLGLACPACALTDPIVVMGDLSARFVNNTAKNFDFAPAKAEMRAQEELLSIVSRTEVVGHNGTRVSFQNNGAPIRQHCMVFGNSFFERGASPTGLSWWFARWFERYDFIWSPEIDFDLVERTRPDIVIGQTIERFLTKLPRS